MRATLLFIAVAVCVGTIQPSAYAGFGPGDGGAGVPVPYPAGPPPGTGGNAQQQAVAGAIAAVANSGRPNAAADAAALTAMWKAGLICKDSSLAAHHGAMSYPYCRAKRHPHWINVNCMMFGVDPWVFGATLRHELHHYTYHAAYGSTLSYDQIHCMIYYAQYVMLRKRCEDPSTSIPAAARAAACTEATHLASMYSNFKAWYEGPNQGKFPPAPPGGWPHYGMIGGCHFPYGDLQTSDPYLGGIGCSGNGILTQSWFKRSDSTTGIVTIDTGIDTIRDFAYIQTASGADVAVAVGTDSAHATGKIVVVTDSDQDGLLDAVSTLGTGNGLVAPNGVAAAKQANGSIQWFVLDAPAGRVIKLADSNSDSIPDGAGATFATTSLCTEISSAASLRVTGPVGTDGVPTGIRSPAIDSMRSTWSVPELDRWYISLIDSDADGVADDKSATTTFAQSGWIAPAPWLCGCGGDTMWTVVGKRGSTVAVYAYNSATSAYDILRGTGVVGSTNLATLTLSSSFSTGDTYLLKDTTTGLAANPWTVEAVVPQIGSVSPNELSTTGAVAITLTGQNFPSSPGISIDFYPQVEGSVTTTTASILSANSTTITFIAPASPDSEFRIAEIRVTGGSEDAKGWYLMYH